MAQWFPCNVAGVQEGRDFMRGESSDDLIHHAQPPAPASQEHFALGTQLVVMVGAYHLSQGGLFPFPAGEGQGSQHGAGKKAGVTVCWADEDRAALVLVPFHD